MADLIIKPATGDGNKLILQDKAGGAVLTTADSGATIANATIPTITGNVTASGNLTVAGDFVPSAPLSNRNTIINGDFNVWQRGTSFTGIGSWAYAADRWAYGDNSEAVHNITASTDVPTQAQSGITSQYSLKIDVTTVDSSVAAGHYSFLYQKLEGYHMRGLFGNPVTLSFWVKSNKTGIYTVCWRNNNLDMNLVKEYTISSANTWEKKVINWTFDNSGGTWGNFTTDVGGWMCWNFAHGTNFNTTKDAWQSTTAVMNTAASVNFNDSTSNELLLSQVQLERGSLATPFEVRSHGEEELRCMRYFLDCSDQGAMGRAYMGHGNSHNGSSFNSGEGMFTYQYPVPLRTGDITFTAIGTWNGSGASQGNTNFGPFTNQTNKHSCYVKKHTNSVGGNQNTLKVGFQISAEL